MRKPVLQLVTTVRMGGRPREAFSLLEFAGFVGSFGLTSEDT